MKTANLITKNMAEIMYKKDFSKAISANPERHIFEIFTLVQIMVADIKKIQVSSAQSFM